MSWGPWGTEWGEGLLKSVIRRLHFKYRKTQEDPEYTRKNVWTWLKPLAFPKLSWYGLWIRPDQKSAKIGKRKEQWKGHNSKRNGITVQKFDCPRYLRLFPCWSSCKLAWLASSLRLTYLIGRWRPGTEELTMFFPRRSTPDLRNLTHPNPEVGL